MQLGGIKFEANLVAFRSHGNQWRNIASQINETEVQLILAAIVHPLTQEKALLNSMGLISKSTYK